MAQHTVAAGDKAIHGISLVAATQDEVDFTDSLTAVEIVNLSGSSEIYVTVDGTNATVGGANTIVLPAAIGSLRLEVPRRTQGAVVKLISPGTPRYSVQGVR